MQTVTLYFVTDRSESSPVRYAINNSDNSSISVIHTRFSAYVQYFRRQYYHQVAKQGSVGGFIQK